MGMRIQEMLLKKIRPSAEIEPAAVLNKRALPLDHEEWQGNYGGFFLFIQIIFWKASILLSYIPEM